MQGQDFIFLQTKTCQILNPLIYITVNLRQYLGSNRSEKPDLEIIFLNKNQIQNNYEDATLVLDIGIDEHISTG